MSAERVVTDSNSGSSFAAAVLLGTNMTGCKLKNADFSSAVLDGTNFSGADLRAAQFAGAEFIDANLRGAKLADANLRGAAFHGDTSSEEHTSELQSLMCIPYAV